MGFETLPPAAAHERMAQDDQCVLLDVRTVEEFERGHPAGAINIPWAERDAGGSMAPNPDFDATVEKQFGKDARLYLACQGGVRSLHATRQLEAAGYTSLVNVDGGFGGRRDPSSGEILCPGWQTSGLPIETTASTYAVLKA